MSKVKPLTEEETYEAIDNIDYFSAEQKEIFKNLFRAGLIKFMRCLESPKDLRVWLSPKAQKAFGMLKEVAS